MLRSLAALSKRSKNKFGLIAINREKKSEVKFMSDHVVGFASIYGKCLKINTEEMECLRFNPDL